VSAVVHELPARPASTVAPDRYLSRAGLAEHLDIHVKTVDRMVRQGCPSHTFGRRLRKFKLAEVDRWIEERERRTMAPSRKRPGGAQHAPGPAPRNEVVMQEQPNGTISPSRTGSAA